MIHSPAFCLCKQAGWKENCVRFHHKTFSGRIRIHPHTESSLYLYATLSPLLQ